MSIRINCPQCKAELRLADAMAGRTGACRECGSAIQVPRDPEPYRPLEERPLGKASMNDIMSELARRGQTAVLTVLGDDRRLAGGGAGDSTVLEASGGETRVDLGPGVRQYATEEMSNERLEQLFEGLSRLARQKTTAASAAIASGAYPTDLPSSPRLAESSENFDFKGDPLGMSLADFKLRHERTVAGRRRRMPWCSDEQPGVNNPELMCESWHTAAGIIHARIELPFENNSPTVGGIRSELVIYQFIDERLFQITAFLPPEGLNQLTQALRVRYGEPQSTNAEERQMHWWKLCSSVEVTTGRMSPREPCVVRYYHDELLAEAAARRPRSTTDL